MNNDLGISVIICCFNSASRLPRTLECIINQKISESIRVEVIVVNNNSSDNTVFVAQQVWSKVNISMDLIIVEEITPGLIHARQKGIATASNEIVVFCDDDNWLEDNYLQISYDQMMSDSAIGALGGQGIAVSDVEYPDWFEKVQNAYACGKQLAFSGDASSRGYLWGAGLVSRKSILQQVFDSNFPFLCQGRKGDVLLAGDDSEICHRIIIQGYRLLYNENLYYSHFISSNRLSLEYYNRMIRGFQLSDRYHLIYKRFFLKCFLKTDSDIMFFSKLVVNLIYVKLFRKSPFHFVTFNFLLFFSHWFFDSDYREKVNRIKLYVVKYKGLGVVSDADLAN